ncbi:MAG TPA: AAA family ATPase [Dehalococcoidales bacterium]|nr:AAA family ATPase [Dehalococcoidales bacterium]
MSKPAELPVVELNEQFRKALYILENSRQSIFITGRAGTGKSTLLGYFRRNTKKKVVVLAPTGVAALNVSGQTIHSFFKFKPNISLDLVKKLRASDEEGSLYQKLETLVIDEISMVRADLLDCVDKFLRLNGPHTGVPFGGIQMVFIGDLYQLPPVVTSLEKNSFSLRYETPYFYSARVFTDFKMEFLELEKIYRQHDAEFINLLNSIRNKTITEEGLQLLNSRCQPDFEPPASELYIQLTTTNEMAAKINALQLRKLRGKLRTFIGVREGDFGDEYLPTQVELDVKNGAQIMMLTNDFEGRWVNGTMGEISGFTKDKDGSPHVIVTLSDGDEVEVSPFTWEISRFVLEAGSLKTEIVGSFTQFPFMLAWAITIHKSQGKTFNKVIIDIGRGTFAHGQMYVALSRCTTLEGIVLKRPILKKHIWMDWKVVDFLTRYQYQKSERNLPAAEKLRLIQNAIAGNGWVEIVYLKPDDVKSRRTIKPVLVGEMNYLGVSYLGMRAFCLTRKAERTFRVDRILEISEVSPPSDE